MVDAAANGENTPASRTNSSVLAISRCISPYAEEEEGFSHHELSRSHPSRSRRKNLRVVSIGQFCGWNNPPVGGDRNLTLFRGLALGKSLQRKSLCGETAEE